jgi:ABC-type uncharacterized transport system substrate-binding protein
MAGSLLAAPLAAEGQPTGKVYRIATMASVNPRSAPFFQAFEQRLRELGWVDGQNIAIDFRGPMSPENYPAVAAEFVRQGVDVILATGADLSLKAVRQATSTIPIVIVALNYDPIEKGHVASLGRPGGNVTGVFSRTPEQGAKQLEFLKDMLPKVTRVGAFWEKFSSDQLSMIDTGSSHPSFGAADTDRILCRGWWIGTGCSFNVEWNRRVGRRATSHGSDSTSRSPHGETS